MKKLKITIFLGLILTASMLGNDRRVLIEIFTNSHCSICPAAYAAVENILQSPDGDNIELIYYHMTFPYSDDQLYQHNPDDSNGKNSFYGPHSSTPKAYFDGTLVSNSYSNWGPNLNDLLKVESPFSIELSAEIIDESISINAAVTQGGEISGNPSLAINFVIVEDVIYDGRNGISDHKNVMRAIVNPQGEAFDISLNETKNLNAAVELNGVWDIDKIRVITFIQDMSTKEVYQSVSLPSAEFGLTDVNSESQLSSTFKLSPNYPNPFNPTTTISYTIPRNIETAFSNGFDVKLKIYDILGEEIATVVDERQNPGEYSVNFDGSELSSGFYYYQLRAGDFVRTRKMILLK